MIGAHARDPNNYHLPAIGSSGYYSRAEDLGRREPGPNGSMSARWSALAL